MKKRTSTKRSAFLAAYALCGNVSRAAQLAGCDRSAHYGWLEDPEYAEAFGLAHEESVELLEAEARRRAMEGVEEPVIYQGELTYLPKVDRRTKRIKVNADGRPVLSDTPLTIRKYSDVLLIFLLKGAKPDKYRDNFKGEIKLPSALNRKVDLSKLTDEQLEQLESIAAAIAGPGGDRRGESTESEAADPAVLPG